jgi:hypothetical protein
MAITHSLVLLSPLRKRISVVALNSCSVLQVFASSPLRGEDNEGFAKRCRREVGVAPRGWTGGPKSPPPRTANSIFVKNKNRAVLSSPLKGEEEKNRRRMCAERPSA